MADAMTGQTMRIQDATARLTRRAGQLTLTVGGALEGSRDSRMDIAILRRAAEAETEIATVFRDLAARDLATVSPALAWLDLMRAPISGRLALQLGDDGTVGDLEARLDIGAGRVWLGQDSAPLGFDRIGADMLYDPVTRRLTFSALRLDAPELRFTAEGHADVAADGTSFVSQFRLSGIEAQPEGLDTPRAIEGATLDLRLTLMPDAADRTGAGDASSTAICECMPRARSRRTEDGLALSLDADRCRRPTWRRCCPTGRRPRWPTPAAGWPSGWMRRRSRASISPCASGRGRSRFRPCRCRLRIWSCAPCARARRSATRGRAGADGITGWPCASMPGRWRATGGGPVDWAGTTMVVEDTGVVGPDAHFRITGRGALADVLSLLAGRPSTSSATAP
jgi:hypothetical protein